MRPARCATLLWPLVLVGTGCAGGEARIRVADYEQRVYAAWLGQSVGNMFGIPHEFQYNDEPRTTPIDGWAEGALKRIREANGAFSDDDTDIEYTMLFCMEKNGPEPTYEQVAEFWKLCINHHIWVANRSARDLMDKGYLPPLTGRRGVNPNWYQIDPQLVCEIWAVTCPGMVDYAAAKADWAAKVTNDDYGTHPTVWYNAMYAAAFFERDVNVLCQIGYDAVPQGSIFREAIDDVRRWKAEHGDDWVAVRKKIKEKYHDRKGLAPDIATGHVSALLNGTLGVLALLYGEGDFEKTLHMACMAGYDADNQAATLAGLIALANGPDVIPRKYTYILDGWTKPLNDVYKNTTRDHLPNGSITDIAKRTANLGVQLVRMHGGRVVKSADGDVLVINTRSRFSPPPEVRLWPVHVSRGREADVGPLFIGTPPDSISIDDRSTIPPGMALRRVDGRPRIVGTPTQVGCYDIIVTSRYGRTDRRTALALYVDEHDFALDAARALAAVTAPTGTGSRNLNVIRDEGADRHYDSFDGENELAEDYYGYEWCEPVTVSRVVYRAGPVFPNGGWFDTLGVQYRNEEGAWLPVEALSYDPAFNEQAAKQGNGRFTLRFKPVTTTAIRIAGKPGGSARFTSIRQLAVYEQ